MGLWTYHPSDFKVDDPNLKIDPSKGQYSNEGDPKFVDRYREILLPKLQQLVRTKQFLWCYTVPGQGIRASEDIDVVEWELDVPATQVLRRYDEKVWHEIYLGNDGDWDSLGLFVSEAEPMGKDIGALVRVPLKEEWVTNHGQLKPMYPRV